MATHISFPTPVSPFLSAGYSAPQETFSNLECTVCSQPFFDEEDGDDYETMDGETVCSGRYSRCKLTVAAKAFRRDSAHMLLGKIDEAREELAKIAEMYSAPEIEDDGHPELLLNDVKRYTERFRDGKPTGYSRDLMLTFCEAYNIERAMREAVAALPAGTVRDALAAQLLALSSYEARSKAGA